MTLPLVHPPSRPVLSLLSSATFLGAAGANADSSNWRSSFATTPAPIDDTLFTSSDANELLDAADSSQETASRDTFVFTYPHESMDDLVPWNRVSLIDDLTSLNQVPHGLATGDCTERYPVLARWVGERERASEPQLATCLATWDNPGSSG